MKVIFAIVLATLTCACASSDTQNSSRVGLTLKNGMQRFMLDNDDIGEASGLTKSLLNDQLLWVHNDSGDDARLFAIDSQGRYQGQLTLQDVRARDWEDVASFAVDGRNFLLIADMGDNNAVRSLLSLYIIEEPDVSTQVTPFALNTNVVRQIDFGYADGARDAESIAVDVTNQHILILSKRDTPPRLYQLPLNPPVGVRQTARLVAEVTSIPAPTSADLQQDPHFGQLGSQPTAMDIRSDGRELLIVTYKEAYRYPRAVTETWAEALAQPPITVGIPQLPQTEAGGYSRDGDTVYIASEQWPAALVSASVQ